MDKQQKRQFVEAFHERLQQARGSFLVDYKGLDVETLNRLRGELRKVGVDFQVVKNRLLKLACEETQTAAIRDRMTGPTAIALTYEDVVKSAKALVDFARGVKKMEIRCAQISGKALDAKAVERLAELPGRDVLLAQTLSAMQAVPASLVRVLGGVLNQLVYLLSAIEKRKAAAEEAVETM